MRRCGRRLLPEANMTRVARTLTALVLAAGVACASPAADPPDLTGSITDVRLPDPSIQALAVVRVSRAGGTTPATPSESVVTLTGNTEIVLPGDSAQRLTDFRALQVGQTVDIWFAEQTGETNPSEHQARRILITGRP